MLTSNADLLRAGGLSRCGSFRAENEVYTKIIGNICCAVDADADRNCL